MSNDVRGWPVVVLAVAGIALFATSLAALAVVSVTGARVVYLVLVVANATITIGTMLILGATLLSSLVRVERRLSCLTHVASRDDEAVTRLDAWR